MKGNLRTFNFCNLTKIRTARLPSTPESSVTSEQNHMVKEAWLIFCSAHMWFTKPFPPFQAFLPLLHSSSQSSALPVQQKVNHYCLKRN